MKSSVKNSVSCSRCSLEFLKQFGPEKYCTDCKPLALRDTIQRGQKAYRDRNSGTKEYREKRALRQKAYREDNLEKCRESVKRTRKSTPEMRKAYMKKWSKDNAVSISAKNKAKYQANRELILAHIKTEPVKTAKRAYEKNRRLENPSFRLNSRMSANIRQALKGRKAGRQWETLVGYTLQDLFTHLERQFTDGMSWANMGEWHIDHIVPKSSFIYETFECEEFKAAWAITNLRPLWASENIIKHAQVFYLI